MTNLNNNPMAGTPDRLKTTASSLYQYKLEPLTDDEATRLTQVCKTIKEKLLIWVLLDTGLRVNELCTLTKQNILWQERRLMIYGKGGVYGKATKRRIVPLTPRAFQLLSQHFTSEDTFPLKKRAAEYLIKRLGNRANIVKRIVPHSLRHTFAVNCLKRGISIRALQLLLGHDHMATTSIYLRLSPEDVIQEFEQKFYAPAAA